MTLEISTHGGSTHIKTLHLHMSIPRHIALKLLQSKATISRPPGFKARIWLNASLKINGAWSFIESLATQVPPLFNRTCILK